MRRVAVLAVAVLALLVPGTANASAPPGAHASDANCSDFNSQAAAQDYFESRGGPSQDPDGLDGDGDGVACESNPCPCRGPGQSPPPPAQADSDGDGLSDAFDTCPTQYALTENGCPAPTAPPRAYVGRFDFEDYYVLFGRSSAFKPRSVHPFSADNGAWLYGLRWTNWGKGTAVGRGKAKANNCRPSCARGRLIGKRGARVKVYRLRAGDCRGKPARFYTRARLYFPRGLRLRPFTVKLVTGCGRT